MIQKLTMGLSYELKTGVICLTAAGDVVYEEGLKTFAESIAEAGRVTKTEGDPEHWHLMFDIRNSAEDRSEEELKGIAIFVSQHRDILSGRMAIVTADDFHYRLARVFEAFAEELSQDAGVFRDIDQAEAWLHQGLMC